jgi:hypothetical protein
MEAPVGATPLHTPSWGPHRTAWKSTPPPASRPANQFSRRVDCAHSCIQHPPNPPKTLKTSMHEPKRATTPYNPTFHSPTTRSFIKPTYKNPPAMPNFFLTRKPQIVDEVDEFVLINTAPSPIKPTIGNLQTNLSTYRHSLFLYRHSTSNPEPGFCLHYHTHYPGAAADSKPREVSSHGAQSSENSLNSNQGELNRNSHLERWGVFLRRSPSKNE